MLKPPFAGKEFAPGDHVELPGFGKLEIVELIDTGKRGRVYKALNSKGKEFALKIAKDAELPTLNSFSREADKVEALKGLGTRPAKLFVAGSDYVVREWIEGQRADVWIRQWEEQGSPHNSPEARGLLKLLEGLVAKGAYVGDLNPKNLIWNPKRKAWVIVDSGSIRQDMSPIETFDRYREKIVHRWSAVAVDCADAFGELIDKIKPGE